MDEGTLSVVWAPSDIYRIVEWLWKWARVSKAAGYMDCFMNGWMIVSSSEGSVMLGGRLLDTYTSSSSSSSEINGIGADGWIGKTEGKGIVGRRSFWKDQYKHNPIASKASTEIFRIRCKQSGRHGLKRT